MVFDRRIICYNQIMKKIFSFFVAIFLMAGVVVGSGAMNGGAFAAVVADGGGGGGSTPATGASGTPSNCTVNFLGFKPWYDGLDMNSDCSIKSPADNGGMRNYVWRIVLNISFDLMEAVGLIAVGFIIYGGYLFITSEGDPGKSAKARKTLTGAIIGLLVAVFASVIINTIITVLKG